MSRQGVWERSLGRKKGWRSAEGHLLLCEFVRAVGKNSFIRKAFETLTAERHELGYQAVRPSNLRSQPNPSAVAFSESI